MSDREQNTDSAEERPARPEGERRPSRFGGPRPDGGEAGGDRGPRGEGGGDRGPRGGGGRRGGGGGGRFGPRRKVCAFCADNIEEVDYKDIARLRRHLSERGKIEPRRKLGTCARHQRSLTVAIKRARHVALLPFVSGSARG
jgi:small subunit ribosomal protein S18